MLFARILTVLSVCLIGAASIFAAPASAEETGPSDPVAHVVQLINNERSAAGLPPLRTDGALNHEGQQHSVRMAEAGTIFHNDALFTRETKDRLNAKTIGENVAMNSSLDDAHRRLMASDGHRANILKRSFDRVGIGAVRSGSTWYLTEVFVESRPAAPAPKPAPAPAPAPVAAPTTVAASKVTAPPAPPTTAAPAPVVAPAPATVAAPPVDAEPDVTTTVAPAVRPEIADVDTSTISAESASLPALPFGLRHAVAALATLLTVGVAWTASRQVLGFS